MSIKTHTTKMTWNELNKFTEDMLPDMLGAQWEEMVDEGYDDEPVYSCQALDMVIETLQEIGNDMPFGDERDSYMLMHHMLKGVR